MNPKPNAEGVHEPIELNELYAIVGNADNTLLPIVNPQTGEDMPILDKKWLNEFAENYSVQYRKLFEWIDRIHRLTGKRLRDLKDVTSENTPKIRQLIEEIRQKILDELPFLRKIQPEARDHMLRHYGKLADGYINETIREFFPDYEHELNLKNEVATCNDAAKLLLMCFDTTLDHRVRFEARRKLLLMEYIGRLEDFNEEDKDHEDALSAMIDFMNRKMITVPEGGKKGMSFQRFLFSRHNSKEGNLTESAHIVKNPPSRKKPNDRVTPIGMRYALIANHKGQEREIYFYTIPREKGTSSRLTKMFRYGTQIGKKDTDRNGIRMIFEHKQDWVDFFTVLQKRLKEEIKTGLEEHLGEKPDEGTKRKLQERLVSLDQSVVISEEKDNLDGHGSFKGNSSVSSGKTKFLKFKMEVQHADNQKFKYEFQIFLPDGFADYMYRKEVSWEEYKVKRFFDEQVAEMLFPSAIFLEINKEEAKKKIMERAYQQVWCQNDLNATHSAAAVQGHRKNNRRKK